MSTAWCRPSAGGYVLSLHIQPGAKRTEIVGEHGDALKVRLAAPPVDGKANAALLAFLSQTLCVPRSQVELIGGETSRQKRVAVKGNWPDEAALVAALMPA